MFQFQSMKTNECPEKKKKKNGKYVAIWEHR